MSLAYLFSRVFIGLNIVNVVKGLLYKLLRIKKYYLNESYGCRESHIGKCFVNKFLYFFSSNISCCFIHKILHTYIKSHIFTKHFLRTY